ncbi:MAG: 4-hydroxy-tetrahydrodipicolinate synthase [Acidimicrobiales bacterium]
MTGGRFGAVITAMVTPFDADGRVDLDATAQLARWLVDSQGNDALVVTGTTGEAPTLTDDEKADVWRAVAEAVTVPVIAGTGSNDTRHTAELTSRAAGCGATGVLIVAPYYNRPSQAGLVGHFRAAAAATELPVIVYDIPVRTGRKIAHDTLIELLTTVPNIVAVKDAASDPTGSARLISAAPAGAELYSGEDNLNLSLLAVGAVGVISVASHWTGVQQGELIAAFAKGDVRGARELNARLLPSYAFESSEAAPNPVPTKALLRELGLPVGRCRAPMDAEPDGLAAEARAVLAGLGVPAGSARG